MAVTTYRLYYRQGCTGPCSTCHWEMVGDCRSFPGRDDYDEATAEEIREYRKDIKDAYKQKLEKEKADQEKHDRTEYLRLRKKYGDMHEIHIQEIRHEAQQLMSVAGMWPAYKRECLALGIKIIGEDDECSST